jgi:glutamine synthetase
MNRKRNPGKPVHVNMYEESHKVKGAKKLPLTLEKSLDHLSKSKVMQSAFGKNIINSYVKLKNKEIQKYNSATEKKIGFRGSKKKYKGNVITQWEKDNTLDC